LCITGTSINILCRIVAKTSTKCLDRLCISIFANNSMHLECRNTHFYTLWLSFPRDVKFSTIAEFCDLLTSSDLINIPCQFAYQYLQCVSDLNTNILTYNIMFCDLQIHGNRRPSPRPRGSARRKTASSLILRGHF